MRERVAPTQLPLPTIRLSRPHTWNTRPPYILILGGEKLFAKKISCHEIERLNLPKMCCSWLRCRRRVADSAESNAPVQAFEKQLPIEDTTQEEEIQELKPRKNSADLHRVRRVVRPLIARLGCEFALVVYVGYICLFSLLRYYVRGYDSWDCTEYMTLFHINKLYINVHSLCKLCATIDEILLNMFVFW